ncbi:MAG: Inactive metal-dependent protease-like protein [uncultured bacterium]|nr:MAG: Inactive metal-dependent protease-like protein [uncultured bacterium]
MKLIIDTRSNEKTIIALVVDGKRMEESLQTNHTHSQAVLPLIEKIITQQHISLSDITYIEVPVDTGSYTGRRVGAAIAQTLGTLLSISVNGKQAGSSIEILYDTDKW